MIVTFSSYAYAGARSIDTKKDTIEAFLDVQIPIWMKEYHVPCLGIGLIKNGKIKYQRVFGETKNGQEAPQNTVFYIASMIKPIVAILTIKLVESGEWDLDEPIYKYWVDSDVEGDLRHKQLTTRHILSHQSGFPNWRKDKAPFQLRFEFSPGEKYQYSGEGFVYLKHALSEKFEMSIDRLLYERLFKPLGMEDTRIRWKELIDSNRFAFHHNTNGQLYQKNYENLLSRGGSLLTTVADYNKFLNALINNEYIREETFRQVYSAQVSIKEQYAMGLGWNIAENLPNNQFAICGGGSDVGVRAEGIVVPNLKTAIVLFTNADDGLMVNSKIIKSCLWNGETILSRMYGGDRVYEEIKLAEEMLEVYAGEYVQENGKSIMLTKSGNTLQVSGDGVPSLTFIPMASDRFFLRDFNVQMKILRTEDELNIVIHENGNAVVMATKMK